MFAVMLSVFLACCALGALVCFLAAWQVASPVVRSNLALALLFALVICASTVAQAQTVGLHAYTYHAKEGEPTDCQIGTCTGHYQNRTRGLYVVHDGYIAGAYCNSFSLPQYNAVNLIQQRSCNLTWHGGKVWTLAGGDSWDLSASLEAVVGYKANVPALVRIPGVADIIAMPAISARFGPLRATVFSPNAVHFSLEYRLQ
jgi:hypothetical protein